MKKQVYFLCTGNSCRSQMAEGWAKHLAGDSWHIYSAGLEAHGINPKAIETMEEVGIDIRSQTSDKIDHELLQTSDFVITLCGDAEETCPTVSSKSIRIHWGFPDPAKATGTEEEILAEFARIRDLIGEKTQQFLNEQRRQL